MKVLVCGGRDFSDWDLLEKTLTRLDLSVKKIDSIIHGGATGADALAARWGQLNGKWIHICRAQWGKWGKAAGPIRNQEMLGLNPDLVIAFPGGSGTRDMVRQAEARLFSVLKISKESDLDSIMGSIKRP